MENANISTVADSSTGASLEVRSASPGSERLLTEQLRLGLSGLLQALQGLSSKSVLEDPAVQIAMLNASRVLESTVRGESSHEALLKRLPRVKAQCVAELLCLPLFELQRRALIQKDWLESYSECLDGLGLSIGVDGARLPRDIRNVIEALRAKPTQRRK